MDIYIIDTNIVFSAAMNANSSIGRFIMAINPGLVSFYAPTHLKDELEKHFEKLVERSQLIKAEVQEQLNLVYSKITFVSDNEIPMSYYLKAVQLVRDVDMDDLVFVAMNDYLEGVLWTGDTKLYRHLIQKGYERVVNFEEIQEHYK